MPKVITRTLPHFDTRPRGTAVDTIIIHSIYAPGEQNELSPTACIKLLDAKKVASHYLIDRLGKIYKLVAEDKRAWHAGVSKMPDLKDGRENVNHFSLGIELIGRPGKTFSTKQYSALSKLTEEIISRHKIAAIMGHEHIAPGRKTDPGPAFDWEKYRVLLKDHGIKVTKIRFPDK